MRCVQRNTAFPPTSNGRNNAVVSLMKVSSDTANSNRKHIIEFGRQYSLNNTRRRRLGGRATYHAPQQHFEQWGVQNECDILFVIALLKETNAQLSS
jgi:hypothetical protein